MQYIQIFASALTAAAALACVRLAFRLIFMDAAEYQKSRSRYSSVRAAFIGKAKMKNGDVPDSRVRAGIIFNKSLNQIEANGKLRNDVVDRIS